MAPFCEEHGQLREDIGAIKAQVADLHEDLCTLTKRIEKMMPWLWLQKVLLMAVGATVAALAKTKMGE